jgi:hypothetical protein
LELTAGREAPSADVLSGLQAKGHFLLTRYTNVEAAGSKKDRLG